MRAAQAPCVDGSGARSRLLAERLTDLREQMLALEAGAAAALEGLPRAHRESAANLLHYLALRRHDLRPLQEELAAWGLSSLGRAESHVRASVEAVLGHLRRLSGRPTPAGPPLAINFAEGERRLEARARSLLGPRRAKRHVRIMVTMPGEAADDYALVRDLVGAGMNCMRINCAHDDPAAWSRMIGHLRRARGETGRRCRVLMDLPGPKLRTGPVVPGPQVVKWKPVRDVYGRVVAPARIWLTPEEAREGPPEAPGAVLPLAGAWLEPLAPGDVLKFFDTRGSSRRLKVVGRVGRNLWAESVQTAYVAPGVRLSVRCEGTTEDESPAVTRGQGEGVVGALAPLPQAVTLEVGDTLVLTRPDVPGRPAQSDRNGRVTRPAHIGVTLAEVLGDVGEGERVWFDDGKIGGRVREVRAEEVEVEITHARPGGERLWADKGINLPDSPLRLPPLTDADLEALPFIARHADLVGYSFVRTAGDVRALQSRLAELGGSRLGLVLKIETRRAFERLPDLILAAMRSPSAGVMIARGDLAVECGYERLAEVQEEILWVCEAAHVPVIWATQVLETLAKNGLPSRAEITDAAMGERAECVMLNKGPYVVEAVRALDDILRRMQSHQSKKRSMLRHLRLADIYAPPAEGTRRGRKK